MISQIEIFGRSIPLYGICFFGGIGIAVAVALLICKRVGFPRWELVYSAIYIMIGAMIGAKLLFIAVSWKTIVALKLPLIAVIQGGFVFYGGLIGGVAGLWIYTKLYKMKFADYVDIYAAVVPLGHAFGRVGCFFAGCCYGIPCRFGVVYESTVGTTPVGVRLLPIQLIEAAALLVLFFVLLALVVKKKRLLTTFVYCISYPLMRFVLEFFRGDSERGLFLGISTSQYVSIAIVMATIACTIIYKRFLFESPSR